MQLPWVLLPDLAQREAGWAKHSKALLGGRTTLHLTNGAEVTVTHRPLALEARVGGKPALKFNAEGLLQYEHRRQTRVSASARRCGVFRRSARTCRLAVKAADVAYLCSSQCLHAAAGKASVNAPSM